jgi:hypothetical protein
MAPAVPGRRAGRSAAGAGRSASGRGPGPRRRSRAAASDAGRPARGSVADAAFGERSGARRPVAALARALGAPPRPAPPHFPCLVGGGRGRSGRRADRGRVLAAGLAYAGHAAAFPYAACLVSEAHAPAGGLRPGSSRAGYARLDGKTAADSEIQDGRPASGPRADHGWADSLRPPGSGPAREPQHEWFPHAACCFHPTRPPGRLSVSPAETRRCRRSTYSAVACPFAVARRAEAPPAVPSAAYAHSGGHLSRGELSGSRPG